MSVLFMGSGAFGLPILERLAGLRTDIVVATVPDAPRGRRGKLTPTPIKERAQQLQLPVLEAATLSGEHGSSVLRDSAARLVIVADFRLMLTRSFLAGPERACYNLHGSVLPRWRGAAPIQHGVMQGDREFGVTLYQMVRALDAGPIVDSTSWVPAQPLDAPEIELRVAEMAADLTERWLPVLWDGDVPLCSQDESGVTLAPKLEKSMGWVPWEHEPESIVNRIRALKPWPRTFTTLHRLSGDETRVFIDQASVASTAANTSRRLGEVVAVDSDGITVACGDGSQRVTLEVLQRAGKKSLPASEFLRGSPVAVGDRFESETESP